MPLLPDQLVPAGEEVGQVGKQGHGQVLSKRGQDSVSRCSLFSILEFFLTYNIQPTTYNLEPFVRARTRAGSSDPGFQYRTSQFHHPPRSCRASCGFWLVWARMAAPACCLTLFWLISAASLAMSASKIRERASVRFKATFSRLDIVDSKRF